MSSKVLTRNGTVYRLGRTGEKGISVIDHGDRISIGRTEHRKKDLDVIPFSVGAKNGDWTVTWDAPDFEMITVQITNTDEGVRLAVHLYDAAGDYVIDVQLIECPDESDSTDWDKDMVEGELEAHGIHANLKQQESDYFHGVRR